MSSPLASVAVHVEYPAGHASHNASDNGRASAKDRKQQAAS